MADPVESFFTVERFAHLFGFAMAAGWTPGPNNMMLANSGASFGFRRSVPHAMGVALGFGLMAFIVAAGLGQVFQSSALLREILRWGGAAMLLYLAWRVATASGGLSAADGRGRPFSFFEAAAFQWINPKAWMMLTGASSAYLVGKQPVLEALGLALIFLLGGLSSAHGWAWFGAALRGWLSQGRRLRIFNLVMGATLALLVILMLWDTASDG